MIRHHHGAGDEIGEMVGAGGDSLRRRVCAHLLQRHPALRRRVVPEHPDVGVGLALGQPCPVVRQRDGDRAGEALPWRTHAIARARTERGDRQAGIGRRQVVEPQRYDRQRGVGSERAGGDVQHRAVVRNPGGHALLDGLAVRRRELGGQAYQRWVDVRHLPARALAHALAHARALPIVRGGYRLQRRQHGEDRRRDERNGAPDRSWTLRRKRETVRDQGFARVRGGRRWQRRTGADAATEGLSEDDVPSGPHGAESAAYQAAGLGHGPKNAPFETITELDQVLGMTATLLDRLRPLVTVYARQAGIVESPGGVSPPGAPKTVHDPLEFTRLPMPGRCHDIMASGRRAAGSRGAAGRTSPLLPWSDAPSACICGEPIE